MKKILAEAAIGLALCAADIPFVIAENPWTYEQNFNGLNDGALAGQDGWTTSGTGTVSVVTTDAPYEGSKHLEMIDTGTGSTRCDRALSTSVESGTMYFSVKNSVTNHYAVVWLNPQTGDGCGFYLAANGHIKIFDHTTYMDTGIDYSADTYYRIGIRFECSANGYEGLAQRHWKYNIDGGAWSDEYGIYNDSVASLGKIMITSDQKAWFDYLGPNYEVPTPTPTVTPTDTPSATPTQTPTPTDTPDIVPPAAPVVMSIKHDMSGRITEICGTSSSDTASVEVFDGVTSRGTVAPSAGVWCLTPPTPLAAGPHSIWALAEDASGQNAGSVSRDYLVTRTVAINAHEETDQSHTHSVGTSLRLEQDGSCEFKGAVNGGETVTVKAWLRKNSSYGDGAQPKVTLSGLGISGTGAATASMTAGPDIWQQLTVTGTPDASGVLTLKVETFSTADGAKAWIDDVTVSQ